MNRDTFITGYCNDALYGSPESSLASRIWDMVTERLAKLKQVTETKVVEPPPPTGDVPEWFAWELRLIMGGENLRRLWKMVEAEITRRVAETTAEQRRLMDEVDEEHKCRIHWEGKCGDLQAEVERLSRGTWHILAREAAERERDKLAEDHKRNALVLSDLEQRLTKAERERDELRAACVELLDAPHQEHFSARMNDEETAALDRIRGLVAAYRGRKEPAQ